ncbi:aldehyde dehydrogenase family protein [Phytohabitans kaempferiae]|uniref:Aldehyde dehydrogenase family protein n=1 Tax=Phytohabitans kaempferiae TaxID=1620943 RepID=A0ABV6M9L5_9ACTN
MTADAYEITQLIDGQWRGGEPVTDRYNPADPADLVSRTVSGTAADVDAAATAAAAAQVGWAAMTGPERGTVLTRAGQLLRDRIEVVARDLTREEGKTLAEATGEVRRAADILEFFGAECWRAHGQTFPSGVADTHVFSRREPLGVVGLITPWNFPIAIPTWKAAPALAAGNAVVLKPAQLTTVSTMHLARALADVGLPPGVLNIVHGSGAVVGESIVRHEMVRAVSFTGSNGVGRRIGELAAARRIRVQLEMGGKNPVVVLDDADPERAADLVAASAFGLTGQACTATSRVICTPSVHDRVVDALARRAEAYAPGDGLRATVKMGPVVSAAQLATNVRYLKDALGEGANLATGTLAFEGMLFPPAVLTAVEPTHRIAQEEVFGPVVSVLRAPNLDAAIDLANAVPFGLSAALVTQNLTAVARFVERIQAGVVKINRPTGGVDLNVPFGGVKESSSNTYREQGSGALDFYTWTKAVYIGAN